jgi:hypothetical protein
VDRHINRLRLGRERRRRRARREDQAEVEELLTRGFLDVITSCDVACRVSAYGRIPRTKRRTATLTIPNRTARIRLKVGQKTRRQLIRTLRTKRRLVLRVNVSVGAADGGRRKATRAS